MDFDFNDCYWHDSILESIYIDRSDPGHKDTVEMVIRWYDEPTSKLIFHDVYLLKAHMNFGIIANESIDTAYVAPEDDEDLMGFRQKIFFNPEKLNCYIIKTNSTGSIIKILAGDVQKVALLK